MYCRHCQRERATYGDVVANQCVHRCTVCHARLADGPMIDRRLRCMMLTAREMARSEWRDDVDPNWWM